MLPIKPHSKLFLLSCWVCETHVLQLKEFQPRCLPRCYFLIAWIESSTCMKLDSSNWPFFFGCCSSKFCHLFLLRQRACLYRLSTSKHRTKFNSFKVCSSLICYTCVLWCPVNNDKTHFISKETQTNIKYQPSYSGSKILTCLMCVSLPFWWFERTAIWKRNALTGLIK